MKAFFLLVIFSFLSVFSYTQTSITGTVKDSETKEPLAFCTITKKGTNLGAITNTDGVFIIMVDVNSDILIFSYLGYDTKTIPATKLQEKTIVTLKRSNYEIDELTIYSGTDYLYDIMAKCRRQIKRNYTEKTAKVYYGLKTQTSNKPVELLECYYNGNVTGYDIDELYYKNGRVAYANVDNFFFSLNTSKIATIIKLAENNSYIPYLPFQFNKYRMKRKFVLKQKYSSDNVINIEFVPKENNNENFSGEVWIEKETYNLLKVEFSVENARFHPFLPLHYFDSLYNVDINIVMSYKNVDGIMLPDYISFNYRFMYHSKKDADFILLKKNILRNIKTNGIIYYYDYDVPFILPYFEYDNKFDDYRKMSFIPYNEVFWNNNNTLLLTEKQKANLDYFNKNGQLINYKTINYGKLFMNQIYKEYSLINYKNGHFQSYYSFWSEKTRIQVNKQSVMGETYSQEEIYDFFLRDMYNLKVQILLDVTQLNDSLYCRSFTVFDPSGTYYHIPEQDFTNAFINIYFDICEIERRKMQKEIDENIYSAEQIDSLYNATKEKMIEITNQYLEEVVLGLKKKEFKKWNNYVIYNLGIDNIKMFKERDKVKF